MKSVFLFDPGQLADALKAGYDLIHLSCWPILAQDLKNSGKTEGKENSGFFENIEGAEPRDGIFENNCRPEPRDGIFEKTLRRNQQTDIFENNSNFPENPKIFENIFQQRYLSHIFENIAGLRANSKILLSLPFISHGSTLETFYRNLPLYCTYFDGFTLQNVGDYALLNQFFAENRENFPRNKYILAGDYSLNVMNPESVMFWADKLNVLAILPELDPAAQDQLAASFPDNLEPELVSADRIIVMRSEHCFGCPARHYHCGACGPLGLDCLPLTDQKGKSFRIITNPVECTSLLLGKINEQVKTAGFPSRGFRREVIA